MIEEPLLELEPAPSAEKARPPQPAAPAFRACDFFTGFFRTLEQRKIPYVILHGYQEFPERFRSDVDYAVADADLAKVRALLASYTRAHGWVVAQSWQHEISAFYSVVVDRENPANHLALDVCSHLQKAGCLLVRDTTLLDAPRRHSRGFFVPAPASEFTYLLAKSLGKDRSVATVLPRLRELRASDPAGVQRRFSELAGASERPVEDWLSRLPEGEGALRATVRARTRYGLGLQVAEQWRRVRRALCDTGVQVAILGPDGAGKSTLIENLQRQLAPCFTRAQVFKFRPDIFGRIEPETNSAPHERAPRTAVISWAKILYYFVDWWLGWLFRLLPARRRGALLLFDRSFDDLIVDQRRYLVQHVGGLARLLRHMLPRADVTFVLDADPKVVHARKPELPVDVIARQREAYRKLATADPTSRLISAQQPAEKVAGAACRDLLLLLAAREERRTRNIRKRIFDLALSIPALLLLAPLLLSVALLVGCKLGTPVVFRQTRPGLHGRPFTIWKFRTMTDTRDASGKLLPDADRLTRFGKWLRSTSLDELPELWNVVRGDMSLVGPRPLLMEYLPLYSLEQSRRHDVLPGITGWAQVNGRNAASWPQKFKLDVWYVENQSLWVDLRIIARTILTVVRREGINQPGCVTADRFRGEQMEASA